MNSKTPNRCGLTDSKRPVRGRRRHGDPTGTSWTRKRRRSGWWSSKSITKQSCKKRRSGNVEGLLHKNYYLEVHQSQKARAIGKDNSPGRDPAQKPLKIWAVWAVFQQNLSGLSDLGGLDVFFLEKPLKPLKSCLKNRSKTAHFLWWFLNGFSSKIRAVFERSSRVEVPDSTFLFSAKLERTRSSRGDQYVVIFQKVPKNSIFDSLFTPETPNHDVPPLSLVRGHLTIVRDINSSKRWGGTSTLIRGGGGGLVCDLTIDYFCYFVETDNKNPDSIFVVHV